MDKKTYPRYVAARAPRSPVAKNCLHAFLVGGGICLFAEGLNQIWTRAAGLSRDDAGTVTAILLVFAAALLTALGLFHRIARFAGGGTLVPITGFANAVAAPAIDSRSEGLVPGVGTKIFTVAGPVLLYGTAAGAVYGLIYWVFSAFL